MIVQFINHFEKWLPAQKVDVTKDRAHFLTEILKVAVICDDQSKLDVLNKKENKEEQSQKIEVHNHYYAIGEE